MKRSKVSTSWVLVWGSVILMVSLIVFIGYSSPLSEFERNGAQISNNVAQAVSANVKSTERGQERREEFSIILGKSSYKGKPLELRDFPSPVQGNPLRKVGNYYSEPFGRYLFHAGVDYALMEGTVIRATQGGKVVFSGKDPLLGQKVTLDCGEGWLVTYGGLDNLRVKEGDSVETQDALGQVGFFPGAEGISNQPQLHYEVWQGNKNNTVFTN